MLNILMLLIMMGLDIMYAITKSLFWKTLASTTFVTIGLRNFNTCIKNKNDLSFPFWMMIGIIYTLVADVLLEIQFLTGAIFFGISHICFFISYAKLHKIKLLDFKFGFSIAMIIMIPLVLIINYNNPVDLVMLYVGLLYVLIISCMFGKSISNFLTVKNETNKILVIGATLYFISEICLILNLFGGYRIFKYPNLILYYLALFFLAMSMSKYTSDIKS